MAYLDIVPQVLQSRKSLLTLFGAFAVGALCRGLISKAKTKSIIRSPCTTLLPSLSPDEQQALPYPPDVFPGARDVDSPYGTIRVWEWGPDSGKKILMIHGISTPCLAFGSVAHGLVEKGCRVMLFDLFGRGYSDSPGDLRQDDRLFSTQILIALTSSHLSWTGPTGFALIGYSLGGGISASFTSYFPHLVSSLVLLAPSGMLRPHHISRTSRFLYSEGILPESLLAYLIRGRLQTTIPPSQNPNSTVPEPSEAAAEEMPKLESNSPTASLSKAHPSVTVATAVNFQVQHHQAFVQSFMSSIRHGPIVQQRNEWSRIGQRLTAQNARLDQTQTAGDLLNGKVLIICGEKDAIIKVDEISEDAKDVLEGNVALRYVDAGHEFPITNGEETVEHIWEFWTSGSATPS